MRVVLQRVLKAEVTINQKEKRSIQKGMLVLAGFEENDNLEDLNWMASKLCNLRIFDDEHGVMNLSIKDIDGEMLIVSQFTLHAKTKKGNRPSYIKAARPETSIPLYETFLQHAELQLGKPIVSGEFGAMMDIQLINHGPVSIIIDSKNKDL